MVDKKMVLLLLISLLMVSCDRDRPPSDNVGQPDNRQPNILVILADDLGYSDIGSFGGEIATPSLDALAAEGIILTQFRVHTVCTPTRAMLMTGRDNHEVGHGTMTEEYTDETRGQPGYEAKLHLSVETLADKLQQLDYETLIAGKWDLGGRGDSARWPINRGFDQSFVLIEGSGSHFTNRPALPEMTTVTYVENDTEVSLPSDFFSSNAYADKIIEFIGRRHEDDRPFFGYLSFTAPHYPLQAPDEYINRYAGKYDDGYEPIRRKRIARQKQLGITARDLEPAPRHKVWPAWDGLSDEIRALESRRMEIYAAMVENMDMNIGRVVDHLKSTGQWENTVVIFFSDNGPEGGNPLDFGGKAWFDWAEESFDMSLENMGKTNSYVWAGPGWAHVSATPFRDSKAFTTEGGIRSPLVIAAPGFIEAGSISHASTHVLDLMPTILAMAGADEGRQSNDLGRSMVPLLAGQTNEVRVKGDQLGLEILGRRALVKDNWKITWNNAPWGRDREWSLYDLDADPTELHDLAEVNPEKQAELIADWEAWAEANGVIPIPVYPMGYTNSFTHYEWVPPAK